MILKIETLSTSKQIDIDFDKSLVLLSGHNNTGKTATLCAIYDYLKNDNSSLYNKNLYKKKVYFFTTKRTFISFYGINSTLKKEMLSTINGNEQDEQDEQARLLTQPILDESELASNFSMLSKQKSEFEFLAIELEKNILEGKIIVSENENLKYQPNFHEKPEENKPLELYFASSAVQALASFVFYLRYLAKKNDCIIIDEPELHLQPDNQIVLVRLLARLINQGFKVILNTNSDYVIEEINVLLMLTHSFGEREKLMTTYNYNQNELLKSENISAYYFEKGKNEVVDVPLLKRGIEIDSIDLAIANLGERSDDIYYTYLESDEKIAQDELEEEKLKKEQETKQEKVKSN